MNNTPRTWTVVMMLLGLLVVRLSFAEDPGNPVKLSVKVSGEYTDNRDSTEDGEETFDFAITPRVELGFQGLEERTTLTLYYAPTYRYRTDPSPIQNDTELQHDFEMELKHTLVRRWKIRALDHFNLTDDPAIVERGLTLRRDSSFTLNWAELETIYRLAPETDLMVGGHYRAKNYEKKEVAERSDEDSYGGRVRLWKPMQRQWGLIVEVSAEKWDYAKVWGMDRGFAAWTGSVGIDKPVGSTLTGVLLAGWRTVDYDDSYVESTGAPYAQLLVHFSPPSKLVKLSANLTYQIRNADVYPYASQEFVGSELDVEWTPLKQWTLGAGLGYRRGEYDGEKAPMTGYDPIYGRPGSGYEDAWLANSRIIFRLDDQTSIQLMQTYEEVSTDLVSAWPYTRNATRLAFHMEF